MPSVAEASAARAQARRDAVAARRAGRQGGTAGTNLSKESLADIAADAENRPNAAAAAQAKLDDAPLGSPENPISGAIPEVPELTDPGLLTDPVTGEPISEAGAAQGLVDATATAAAADFESEVRQQERAQDLSTGIQGDITETEDRIDDVTDVLDASKADLDGRIDAALNAVEAIPGQVLTEFDRLKAEFGTVTAAALADIDTKADAAMANVMEGRSEAMQAAVQGIQGNINTAVAKIQSDPNLTAGQKASMIAQTKLAGASSLAPAVGANILEFNKLQAEVATTFGGFTAGLQTAIISEEGAFGRAEGQAFADATIASQNVTSMLLGTQASSDEAYANSMATLEGTRSMAQMTGNQLMFNNLDNLRDPVLNTIDTAATMMMLNTDLVQRDFDRKIAAFGREFAIMMAKWEIGTVGSRMFEALFEGAVEGGIPGAIAGVAGQGASEFLNPAPVLG